MASKALGDTFNMEFVANNMKTSIESFKYEEMFDEMILCHGYVGLLLILKIFYHYTQDNYFKNKYFDLKNTYINYSNMI